MNELLETCSSEQKSISEIMLMMEREKSGRRERLLKMKEAVDSGINNASTAQVVFQAETPLKCITMLIRIKLCPGVL
jgi:L-serine deaminase